MEWELPPVNLVVEGPTDRVVGQKLLTYVGLPIGSTFGEKGKPYLLQTIPNYNQAAKAPFSLWFAIVDLDQDADCAPPFVQTTLPSPAVGMRFRVAVRAVEAWLLADKDALAEFLHVRVTQFPGNPDQEMNPKAALVNLARESTRKIIREDMVPREGSGASVGPGYVGSLIEFVMAADHHWRPDVAVQHSDSLRRCVEALKSFKDWKPTE
jgi:hypothetical protein